MSEEFDGLQSERKAVLRTEDFVLIRYFFAVMINRECLIARNLYYNKLSLLLSNSTREF